MAKLEIPGTHIDNVRADSCSIEFDLKIVNWVRLMRWAEREGYKFNWLEKAIIYLRQAKLWIMSFWR